MMDTILTILILLIFAALIIIPAYLATKKMRKK